ncbi:MULTISPECIES: lipid asymmetry maintenance protein MlaB [unclassified Ketobacter]|jgi:ABC-type transporter Mla MlaB component|uniref:STAS domain-containing protein n=1 Tax=unclassified Ketobacter TaxID=2639109 RepID=UPI0025B890D2|nr:MULTISPECIES: STAS domain-containing protein [unclassified Ketobacter]MEC8810565.1 STAS domain-containing protein [Pseudomonadota bacterium]|tara:strand:+ start:552 stop:833 length:282 start_codon:yes stop_codon:yes gene_type:complete
MAESTTYQLDKFSDISKADILLEKLESYLNGGVSVAVDASQVERIDTSAMQVLLAWFKSMEKQHFQAQIINPSDPFLKAASMLGVSEFLRLKH